MDVAGPVPLAGSQLTTASADDDLIEYSVKRWAPFVCRLRRRIVAFSTDDVLLEYARRLSKPVAELGDRYRAIHNSRRRHRPKRGLSMIWDVATNRPRILFYWSSGRRHFWCCDPLQLCPARFLGDPTLPANDTVERMVDYSLNVLSFFDPSPVIEGDARHHHHRPQPEFAAVSMYDDEDSSASEETYQPAAHASDSNTPTASRTPSPASSSVLDDPIIPYRPADDDDDESSEIRLSESDRDEPAPAPQTPRPPKSRALDEILDQADINSVIAAMQESRPLAGNDVIRTIQSVRHRSIFSPRTWLLSPLVPGNVTFPANVRPMPAEFEVPRPVPFAAIGASRPPLPPARADAATQTEPLASSQDSMLVAATQDQPAICSASTSADDGPGCPATAAQTGGGDGDDDDDDMSLSDANPLLTQADEPSSQTAPFAYWRQQYPRILHFCRRDASAFEASGHFSTYIRFDADDVPDVDCPRELVADAMAVLAPTILRRWVCKRSLIEAPFVSASAEQYAFVPVTDGRGVFLCLNEPAWREFVGEALQESMRKRKSLPKGPVGPAPAWDSISARFQGMYDLRRHEGGYSLGQFHADVADALTDGDTLPDNSALMHSQPLLSEQSGKSSEQPLPEKAAERQPLSDLSNQMPADLVPSERLPPDSTAVPADPGLDSDLGKERPAPPDVATPPQHTQTADYLFENIASEIASPLNR